MSSEQRVKVSVIIPVYNAQKYISECIYSIQKQTMKELEILCVDDESKDGSLRILEEFQKTDDRIRIFQQSNQGAGTAKNLALKNAKGEFVCFMDADDFWVDEKVLEKLYRSAVFHNVHICGGQFYIIKKGLIEAINIYGALYRNLQYEKPINYADYQYDYNYTNYIYRRKLLLDNCIFFPPYKRFEDPPFFVRAMSEAGTFCIVDIPFYCYRVGYKKIQYTEDMMADLLQGMIDNLHFSIEKQLRRLHRLTYYRILEICNRGFQEFVEERNRVLLRKLSEINDLIRWDWLKEVCKINEQILRPLADIRKKLNQKSIKSEYGCSEKWPLPVVYLDQGCNIALYGAGDVGRSYFRQIQENGKLCLCAWADRSYENITGLDYELISPEQLCTIGFDYVVIGVAEIATAMEIMENLHRLGIPAEKVVWDIGR